MKKTVNVEDIIRLAKQQVDNYHIFMNEGKYDTARMVEHRIAGYQSIIMILAIDECEHKDFSIKWDEIHKEIWGE